MKYQKFVDEVFELGKKEGFEDMEVYFQRNNEFETTVFKSEVDKFSISDSAGLSFRGLYSGKVGYAYTELLDEESVEMLVVEAKENASAIESEDVVVIADKQTGYKEVDAFNTELEHITKSEKIELIKKIEEEAMKLDPRIKSMAYNMYLDMADEIRITNTKGMDLNQKSNLAVAYVMALAVENGENKTGTVLLMDRDFRNFDYKTTAKKLVDKTVSLLGAKTVPSKSYEVILKNECAASLLGAFTGIFNAENVQKNLSVMKGKLDTDVASDIVTLIDNPFMNGGFGNASFDAEGTPTKKTEIIKDGMLKSFLHNVKTATIDNVESTGNAAKGSYKSSINVAPSNLYIEAGSRSLEDMTSDLEEGMIITKLDGLHSGLNPISGDFSLAALGYLVEDGKIKRAADQFTVAGNINELLKDIAEIGNDLEFTLPQGSAFVASPSLRIKKLSIAGE